MLFSYLNEYIGKIALEKHWKKVGLKIIVLRTWDFFGKQFSGLFFYGAFF
jgi:hypothetical protein